MNITLIGMSGVGKSFIGKKLASKLKFNFLDLDKVIEKKFNKTLQQIIDEIGEEKFLEVEEKAILSLGKIDNCIICPGGSCVYSKKGMNFLKSISKIVFLNDSLENIKKKAGDISKRGIIGLKNKTFDELFKERFILHKKYSDLKIELIENFALKDAVVNKVLKLLDTPGVG